MEKEEILKIMKLFYTKLAARNLQKPGIIILKSGKNDGFDFYKSFVEYLWERYELLDITKEKCEIILNSILQYATVEIRIKLFAEFLGILNENKAFISETPLVYLTLLNNLSIDFESFFGIHEISQNNELIFENCISEFIKIAPNISSKTRKVFKRELFTKGKYFANNTFIEQIRLKTADVYWILYKLNRTARKKLKVHKFIDHFLNSFNSLSHTEIQENLCEIIKTIAKIQDQEAISQFIERFAFHKGKISADKFRTHILKDSIEIRIPLTDFIETGLSGISQYVKNMKCTGKQIIEKFGKSTKGFLNFFEMELIANKMIKSPKNKWKADAIIEYFL